MLQRLSIRNYALIRELELDFRSGLTIITGETGAGKSILLGAIGLLLGGRAEGQFREKCILEAEFELNHSGLKQFFQDNDLDYDTQCILRRELGTAGKTRAFINDTPVNLQQMRSLGNLLVDIHSQHDTLLLHQSGFRLKLIDGPSGALRILPEYQSAFLKYRETARQLKALQEQELRIRQEKDYLEFQVQELDEAALQENELPGLEDEFKALTHAGEIRVALGQALQTADAENEGITALIQRCTHQVKQAQRYSTSLDSLVERLQAWNVEWKDLLFEMEAALQKVEVNPNRLLHVEQRIDLINRLLQKHRCADEQALLRLRDELKSRLTDAGSLEVRIAELEAQMQLELNQAIHLAKQLSKLRRSESAAIAERVMKLLHRMGMPRAELSFEWSDKALSEDGIDDLQLLFSANPGQPPQEIGKVASGGELSRLMLSLKKVMASSVALPTIIFDEIDTGISGAVAESMGEVLQQMGKELQVISITHLPQIASKGNDHLKVYKSGREGTTETLIQRLSANERIDEIAAMLSGKKLSEAARNNAKALLQIKE
jgi:DNA repair protein RecN (Recombination protein N)